MANDVGQLVAKINRVVAAIEQAQDEAVKKAALVMKGFLLDGAKAYAGSDQKLHNVGKNGAKLTVGFDIRGGSKPLAIMKARGPWGLVEQGAKPHTIRPKRRSGLQAIRLPDGNVRRSTDHPGTSARPVWRKAKELGTPATMKALSDTYIAAVRKTFNDG